MWTPTLEQRAAALDPSVDNLAEAETRVRAAIRMLATWDAVQDHALLDAARDLIVSAKWYATGDDGDQ